MPADLQIDYKISTNAKIALVCLFFIFLFGFFIKSVSMWVEPSFFNFTFFVVFGLLFSLSTAAAYSFLIKKRYVISISNGQLAVAIPYFFQIQRIDLASIKELKTSMLLRSEIIWFDHGAYISSPFMWPFMSAKDRESFLNQIFDLVPNISVR